MTYTLSKSMNDVGEFFFSSPIDPTRHHARLGPLRRRSAASAGDQRHASTRRWRRRRRAWEHLTHGLPDRAACCSTTRRCRSTSSQASPTCRARRAVRWPTAPRSTPNFDVRAVTFIPRNAGTGSDFFTLNVRVSRRFRLGPCVKAEGAGRSVQPDQPREQSDPEHDVGRGRRIPPNPVATFNRSRPSAIRARSSSACD